MKLSPFVVVALPLAILATAARAQDTAGADTTARRAPTARPVVRAERIRGRAPVIDGRLDDAAWRTAPVATNFVQQRPTPGAPATMRTEARVLYDDEALYVGMTMEDPDVRHLAATVARRDYTGYSDWAQVIIDSHHDRRTGFRFGVNPAGVQKDVLEYDDANGEDVSWDAVWQSATHVDSTGWTAEIRIPLSQLRFGAPKGAGADAAQVWGIEFLRDIARLNERDYWAPIPPAQGRFVSLFGDLDGLAGLTSPRRLEVLPYTRASITRAPGIAADPFYDRNSLGATAGADVKYGLTSDLTLTGTINPDFGQVEADPSVVNLTAFETFFPEKRPFFVEGADLFQFNVGFPFNDLTVGFFNDAPFYSRRVGRSPQGALPDTAVYADMPDETTILGAAKLSGKTSRGWTVGVLDAVTGREEARYTDPAGGRLTTPVEPLSNYAVARLRKDLRQGESAIGGIVTATDRRLGSANLDFLPGGAYAAGLDGLYRFGNGAYQFSASALGTSVRGSTTAITRLQRASERFFQRPDASYLHFDSTRTSLDGYAASAQLAKTAGLWQWTLAGHARSPGLEMNDLGFEQSTDWLVEGSQLSYVDFRPRKRVLRDWSAGVQQIAGWSFGGERRATSVALFANTDFQNNWSVNPSVIRQLSAFSLDALRGGPALRVPARTQAALTVNTDARKAVSASISGNAMWEDETGGDSYSVSPTVDVRVGGQTEISVGPSVSWTLNPWQYVTQGPALGATHYLFGRIRQTTVALTTRASYAFTPTLTVQFYGEPFIGTGAYRQFREVASPRASSFDARFRTFGPSQITYADSTGRYAIDLNGDGTSDFIFGNPDFNLKQFRSTAVLRWEYRPGSALFVVWQQGRSLVTPTGTFDLSRDVSDLFASPSTNVLLVKLDYWLDL